MYLFEIIMLKGDKGDSLVKVCKRREIKYMVCKSSIYFGMKKNN